MHPPYITMDSNKISANVVGEAIGHSACIQQNTINDCHFSLGNSVTQLEFDYHVEGDRWSNWFSFWMNCVSPGNRWVKDCEIDPFENMYKSEAHNFAGLGHQVPFKQANWFDGHTTCTF